LFSAPLALLASPAARAQQPQMDALAAKMADAIVHSKQKRVVVFDFIGPGNKRTALGQTLADELSAALAKSSGKFSVEDRSRIGMEEERISILDDPNLAFWAAHHVGANVLLFGKLSLEGNDVSVAVDSYRVDNSKRIDGFQVAIPLTDEMQKLADKIVEGDPSRNVQSRMNGYSNPTCVYCPPPDYDDTYVRKECEGKGTVIFSVLVTPDGRARVFKIANSLPCGLTWRTLETILTWKYKPATGPDGKPAAIVETIEMTYHNHAD
jgi:hypothetical protein